jgi:hypothetical protein
MTAADARHDDALSPEEREFLSKLLERLAEEDRAAHDALVEANPELVELCGMPRPLRERIRAALTARAGGAPAREQERLLEHARVRSAAYRAGAAQAASRGASDTSPGILTSMTRKLPPERAIELYRKITPIVVHQLLGRFNPSAKLGVVQRAVDHLCSEEVHRRLCACEHVRDGILQELANVLDRRELLQEVSREDLRAVLEQCGAMDDLIAMENCIKLAASKAS